MKIHELKCLPDPQDCPDGKQSLCFDCEDEVCHTCHGDRWVEVEGELKEQRCWECQDGTLESQLSGREIARDLTAFDRA